MAKRTGPTNQVLSCLIHNLKKISLEEKVNIWKRIALDLEKPSRQKRVVNLSRINRYTQENEMIVVPGKVLGSGCLNHKITISAFQFSNGAKDKILKTGSKILSLEELSTKNPKGENIRIIG